MAAIYSNGISSAMAQTPPVAPLNVKPAAQNAIDQVQQRLAQFAQKEVEDCTVQSMSFRPTDRTIVYVRPNRTVTIGLQTDETIIGATYDQPRFGEYVEEYLHPDARGYTWRLKVQTAVPTTILTTARRYFMVIRPSRADLGEPCYQAVLFGANTGAEKFNPFGSTAQSTGVNAPSVSETAPQAPIGEDVFTGSPNFNYRVEGDAEFKPVAVYDNGRFTWIQMPTASQQLPALFFLGPNGEEIVNYRALNNDKTLIVNRLMNKFVLRIGETKVIVTAEKR